MGSNIQGQVQKVQQINPQMQINIVQQTQKLYQDLCYITGIAIETQAALDFFKDAPNHQMVNIQLNRMITQANISNGIAFSMDKEAKDDGIHDILVGEKHSVNNYFEELIKYNNFDERINNLLSNYKNNNLTENPIIFQTSIQPMGQENICLSQEVLQKVVNAMGQQDQINDQISKNPGFYNKPSLEQIKQINIQRQRNAQQKLFVNFTMVDFSNQLQNNNQKFKNLNETYRIFNQYFENLGNHFDQLENTEKYNKIYEDLNIDDDQIKEEFKFVLKLLISYDLGTLDTYFCQALDYFSEKVTQLPQIIMNNKYDFR